VLKSTVHHDFEYFTLRVRVNPIDHLFEHLNSLVDQEVSFFRVLVGQSTAPGKQPAEVYVEME